MNEHRGLYAWHLDMKEAKRRGFRRGMIAGGLIVLILCTFALVHFQ